MSANIPAIEKYKTAHIRKCTNTNKHQFNFAPDLTLTEHNATADGELVTHYTDLARRSLLSESHTV
jgi:hypothetical protein